MGKIKLNLVSGATIEKPLINAFKANNNSYVVFDNEMNGSMGLPIILVCKLESNKLVKIMDQNEWQIVKEYLKNIIAGNQIEFIKVADELVADDIYYTQLTLPVPSFDALKNAYKVEELEVTEVSVFDIKPEPEMNVIEPVAPANPFEITAPEVAIKETVPPVMNDTHSAIVEPVHNANGVEPSIEETAEVQNAPTGIDLNTLMPKFEINEEPVEIVTKEVSNLVEPVAEPTSPKELMSNEEELFKEQKEAFLQACENMFDALVKKFEKELENRK